MPEVSQVLGFGWGPGSGQRLLAPGLPDVLLTDGAHLGWLARDGVYALMEDQVHLVAVPQPAGISVSPSCWVVVHPVDGGWDVTPSTRLPWKNYSKLKEKKRMD